MRSFHQVPRNVFERRIDRQNREWRIDMSERQHYGERAVQQEIQWMAGQVHILQQSVEDPVTSQDRFPRVGTNQIADPQRDDHQLVQQIFSLRVKR